MQQSRRNALKILGASALLASGVGVAQKAQAKTSALSPKIAIIGAGLGGITMSASLIKAMPKAQITLFDKDENFYYQPGFTLIAAGIYTLDDVLYKKAELIDEKVKWIKQNVAQILPNDNKIIAENGENFEYDILVIAIGVEYDFNAVSGLSEDDLVNESTKIATIYTPNSAVKAKKLFDEIIERGKKGEKLNVLFSEQKSQNKCGGANKKINFLLDDLLQTNNLKDSVKTTLFTGGGAMLSSPIHAKMIEQFLSHEICHIICFISLSQWINKAARRHFKRAIC